MDPAPDLPARQPMFNLPGIVVAVAGLLALVHLGREFLSRESDFLLLLELAFVPARFTLANDPVGVEALARELASSGLEEARSLVALAGIVLADDEAKTWTAATHALLHASWMHLLSNVVWLLAFGTPVARRLGAARFLLLAIAAVGAGAVAQYASDPLAIVPMIGASGGVSGLMAAAAWFVFTPVPPWAGPVEVEERPRQTLRGLLANGRALAFLGIWIAIDVSIGLLAGPLGIIGGSIAWQAHIGGLVAGLVLFPLIDPRRQTVG